MGSPKQQGVALEPEPRASEQLDRRVAAPARSAFRVPAILIGLGITLIALFFASFMLGRFPMGPDMVIRILLSKVITIPQTWSDAMETVVLQVRLPRIIAAVLVGSALAGSGAAYQTLFKNPLAAPSILGVSAGAGFGAAIGLLFQTSWMTVQALAFATGLLAVLSAFLIARTLGGNSMVVLVLGGTVISALFQALTSMVKFLADPLDTLPSITFWLMGSLNKVTNHDLLVVIAPLLISTLVLFALRWQVNVLSLSDEEAAALGVNLGRTRILVVGCATLMTATAVSISGVVGWVGLIIPHMARMLVGPNFPILLPTSLLLGGTYLLAVDNVARSASTTDFPLGILTAVIGAPFFLLLLAKARHGWD